MSKKRKKPHVYHLRTDNGLNLKLDGAEKFPLADWDSIPKMEGPVTMAFRFPVATECVIFKYEDEKPEEPTS